MPTDPHAVCDKRPHRNTVLSQLRAMQEIAFQTVQDSETDKHDLAALMRAYVELEKQRNVLRMRPAPKPVDVSDIRRKRKRSSDSGPAIPTDTPSA